MIKIRLTFVYTTEGERELQEAIRIIEANLLSLIKVELTRTEERVCIVMFI